MRLRRVIREAVRWIRQAIERSAHLSRRADLRASTIVQRVRAHIAIADERGENLCLLQPGRDGEDAFLGICIIDTSLSMAFNDWAPCRLAAAKDAASAYVDRLGRDAPDALVAIIEFNSVAVTVCSPTPVGERRRLHRAINGLDVDVATNITAGIEAAVAVYVGSNAKTCQCILLTDGEHNWGPGPEGAAEVLRRSAVLETVGIGGSPAEVDEALLRDISSRRADGSPRYRWIGDREALIEHFEHLAGHIARK